MSIKLFKKLFSKPLLAKVDDITFKSVTIKDMPVLLELYEAFEPYLKNMNLEAMFKEKTEEIIIFIHICTGLEPAEVAKFNANKILPIFDRCLEVNRDFFIQIYWMKRNGSNNKPKQCLTPVEENKNQDSRQQSRTSRRHIVSTYKDLLPQDTN